MRKLHIQTVVLATVAAAFVVTQFPRLKSSPGGFASEVLDEIPGRITKVAARDDPAREGKHLGFDTYAYPGDEVMLAWRHEDVPYEWVGYYLPAPCHKGRTWMGKRERLTGMGWGMAVIYVGQQTWDKTPTGFETMYRTASRTRLVSKRVKTTVVRNGKRVSRYVTKHVPVKQTVRIPIKVRVDPAQRPLDDCNAQLVSGTRGAMEAADAIQRTEAEGFPRGTVIFLDIERMQNTPSKMREYYRAWTAHVLADGRYRPGFYAHTRNAELIYMDVKSEYVKAGRTDEPPFWVAGGRDFSPDKAPHEVGHSFVGVWQGVLDIVQEWNGYKLPIDVNVAQVRDPSRPYLNVD